VGDNTKAGWAQTSPPLAFWSLPIGAILEKKGGENQGGQKTKKEENSQGRDLSNPALG
jgi:hypothetical protein